MNHLKRADGKSRKDWREATATLSQLFKGNCDKLVASVIVYHGSLGVSIVFLGGSLKTLRKSTCSILMFSVTFLCLDTFFSCFVSQSIVGHDTTKLHRNFRATEKATHFQFPSNTWARAFPRISVGLVTRCRNLLRFLTSLGATNAGSHQLSWSNAASNSAGSRFCPVGAGMVLHLELWFSRIRFYNYNMGNSPASSRKCCGISESVQKFPCDPWMSFQSWLCSWRLSLEHMSMH